MTSNVAPHQLHVTSRTGVADLAEFARSIPGQTILAREHEQGGMVLYTAPRTFRSLLESALRVLLRRQPPIEEARARDVTANIFMRSLPARLKDMGRQEHLAEKLAAGKGGLTTEALQARLKAFDRLTDTAAVGEGNRFGFAERFAGQKGEHTGGKTGSVKVEADKAGSKQRYQYKFDIQDNPKWHRRFFERHLNVQNVSEVLASAVMRSELQADEAMRAQAMPFGPHVPSGGLFERENTEFEFPDPGAAGKIASGPSASDLFFRSMKNAPIDEDKDPAPIASPNTPAARAEESQPTHVMRAPNVTLLDAEGSRIAAVSEYLPGGKGDLEAYFKEKLGGQIDKRHVRVVMGSEHPPEGTPSLAKDRDRPGVIHIQGQAATDLFDHLASTLWLGDYDFNPAKFIVQEDPDGVLRLGCIDLAHAFQNLTEGRGATLVKAGEAHAGNLGLESDNSFVRAVNQKRLRGDPSSEGGGASKIWRDYDNLAPSLGMAHALQRLAARPDAHVQGLQLARQHVMSLVEHLQADPTPDNRKKLDNLLRTLAQISEHEGHSVRVALRKPADVVAEVIDHLTTRLTQRRQEAQFAGDLCELQASVNAHLLPQPGGPRVSQGELAAVYQAFRERHGDAALKKEIVWFAESAGTPPFKGTYEQFVDDRMRLQAAHSAQSAQETAAANH